MSYMSRLMTDIQTALTKKLKRAPTDDEIMKEMDKMEEAYMRGKRVMKYGISIRKQPQEILQTQEIN